VTDEVRKLAERSDGAAKKIAALITEIQNDIDNAMVAINDGTKKVQVGGEVVNGAGMPSRRYLNPSML